MAISLSKKPHTYENLFYYFAVINFFPRRRLIRWQSFIWYGCTDYNFLQYTTWWLIDPRAEIWHAALLFRENISAGASSNLFGGRDCSKPVVWCKEKETAKPRLLFAGAALLHLPDRDPEQTVASPCPKLPCTLGCSMSENHSTIIM